MDPKAVLTEAPQREFCLALGLSEDAAQVCRANSFSQEKVREAYRLLSASPACFFHTLEGESPQRILALYVQFAQLLRPVFPLWGICQGIYLDTFGDIGLWEREYFARYGEHGLDEYPWLSHHVRMELFRLGSLQFQTQSGALEPVWQAVPLRPGDLTLHVHIPKGADLSPEAVESSFQSALDFWNRDEAVLLCDSWLLGPELQALLPPASRIRSFASGFTLTGTDASSRQGEERIFGDALADPRSYPSAGTSLQRAARAHLMAGGRLSAGFGWQRIRRQRPQAENQ